jgi:RNA polymerase sigma-70 factor (ECF subfamily)
METASGIGIERGVLRGTPVVFAAASGSIDRREERRLVEAAQQGSEESLESLFRLHWPRALKASFLIVHDAAAAEDIAQEAFLSAIRSLDRFDRRRPFGPWLHRIVVNRAIDWTRMRKYRREVRFEPAAIEGETGAGGDGADLAAAGLSDGLTTALAALSAEHRAVVVLRYLLEYTPAEIAKALDLPRGTVNSRLRRALDRLAGAYGEDPR